MIVKFSYRQYAKCAAVSLYIFKHFDPIGTQSACICPLQAQYSRSAPLSNAPNAWGVPFCHCIRQRPAHAPIRHSIRSEEKCPPAGACRQIGAQAPSGRSTDIGEMPACRSISTRRRTSPIGAKSAKRSPPPSDPCKEIPHIRSG